jgi:dihydropteroate synthase
MAIININDDSFSEDGRLDPDWAIGRAQTLIADGADFIDIGAESARTNREAITVQDEIARLTNFCEAWPTIVANSQPRDEHQVWPPVLSVNTWRPEVITAALAMGAELINDMSGLPDATNARLCAESGASLLVMHSVGAPKVDHSHVRWDDIMASLKDFFQRSLQMCRDAGLSENQIILDPGFGFAKGPKDDVTILRNLEELSSFQRPLLLPIGRKGFIGEYLNIADPSQRDDATLAVLSEGFARGGHIFRVHDAKGSFEALKVLSALEPVGR